MFYLSNNRRGGASSSSPGGSSRNPTNTSRRPRQIQSRNGNRALLNQHYSHVNFHTDEYNHFMNDLMGHLGAAGHPGNYAEIDDDYESLIRLSERIGDVKSKGTT